MFILFFLFPLLIRIALHITRQILITVRLVRFVVRKIDTVRLLVVFRESFGKFRTERFGTEEFVRNVFRTLQILILVVMVYCVEYVRCYGDGGGGIRLLRRSEFQILNSLWQVRQAHVSQLLWKVHAFNGRHCPRRGR